MMHRSRAGRTTLPIFAMLSLAAASGCWIVAGLEDRTLLDDSTGEGGSADGPSAEGSTDGAGGDGPTDGGPRRCYIDDPFEEGGTRVMGIESPVDEFGATLTDDELEILVSTEWDYPTEASVRPSAAIWRAKRATRTSAFTNVAKIPFASNMIWGSPTLADDAGVLYLVGYTGADPATYRTGRDGGEYITDDLAVLIGDLDGTEYLAVDNTAETLYYAQRRDAGEPLVLWKKPVARGGAGTDNDPVELKELSTLGLDGGADLAAPVVSREKEALYFVVITRATGVNRVFRATAMPKSSSPKTEFDPSSIREVTEVNSGSTRSLPVWVSPDLCRLYVNQTRGGGARDIYVYEKKPR